MATSPRKRMEGGHRRLGNAPEVSGEWWKDGEHEKIYRFLFCFLGAIFVLGLFSSFVVSLLNFKRV